MFTLLRLSCISICILSLSACMLDGTNNSSNFWDSSPDGENNQLYPEGYDTTYTNQSSEYNGSYKTQKNVVVPQSYHLGVMNTPVASKDEDRQWVDNQNPNGYTIQIADDTKPAPVANQLLKTPKNEHNAEVKSQSGAYIGLHGSYATREAAEAQLNQLPEEVKQKAQIKNWQTIQHEVNH
ncbi:MAG: SPOR domain-containing protein [Legionella sp.]|nr:MAG: SPOR domain-containing protein [Legionella sp.]